MPIFFYLNDNRISLQQFSCNKNQKKVYLCSRFLIIYN